VLSWVKKDRELMVAWGGIEPPTQGFSILIDRFVFVQNQADSALAIFCVRDFVF
jgi:hypothetical protein